MMGVFSCESMSLQIYNSLTRQKEDFTPVEPGKVKMYVCGMTVYSDAHIGHARTYFAFDVIRNYLKYKGFDVLYVQNVTDVDDKIINTANQKNIDALDYSCQCTDLCLNALDDLGIKRADIYPKASEEIPEMIAMIQQLIDKGFAYEVDGDVYFSVEKFPSYGKISGQNIEELKSGARIEPGDKKRSPLDFALWKATKPGEPFWESPWGHGRPGWHIECSAMSSKYLGLPFDIHGGGMDLRFPHHENEIAQAEAATGKPFARYWMHIGLLTIDGEKMSKSIGNIINICDLLKEWDSEVVRFFFAQTHYRHPPDFNETALQNAKKGTIRIHRLKDRLEELSDPKACLTEGSETSVDDQVFHEIITNFKESFEKAMDDDFNTPEAIAVLFDFVNKVNKHLEEHPNPSLHSVQFALNTLVELGKILTLFQDEKQTDDAPVITALKEVLQKYNPNTEQKNTVEDLMDALLSLRQQARKEKNWSVADGIRDDISCLGFEIQDTSDGAVWRKI
jgi:cysteinyl-tRNA synthetase